MISFQSHFVEYVCAMPRGASIALADAVKPCFAINADVSPARAAPPEEPAGDPDFTLEAVRLELESHLKSFVGREEALAEVAAWIDAQTEGRYLLLLGPPGQGKSALMAELARREARRGGCLLHMVKSHPQPRGFHIRLHGVRH